MLVYCLYFISMPKACNYAIMIFNHLDSDHLILENIFEFGSRSIVICGLSEIEQPARLIESRHWHPWIKSRQAQDPSSGSVISSIRVVEALKLWLGGDLNIPYCKPVKDIYAYRQYINKHSGNRITPTDEFVTETLKKYRRHSDTDILAVLYPHLGLETTQNYKIKLSTLRGYVKHDSMNHLPSNITADAFYNYSNVFSPQILLSLTSLRYQLVKRRWSCFTIFPWCTASLDTLVLMATIIICSILLVQPESAKLQLRLDWINTNLLPNVVLESGIYPLPFYCSTIGHLNSCLQLTQSISRGSLSGTRSYLLLDNTVQWPPSGQSLLLTSR